MLRPSQSCPRVSLVGFVKRFVNGQLIASSFFSKQWSLKVQKRLPPQRCWFKEETCTQWENTWHTHTNTKNPTGHKNHSHTHTTYQYSRDKSWSIYWRRCLYFKVARKKCIHRIYSDSNMVVHVVKREIHDNIQTETSMASVKEDF